MTSPPMSRTRRAVVDTARAVTPPTGSATVRETHTSYVFLLNGHAFKMKKPIRTDFLDFRTLDSRWLACDREFTLNSRFAPDVYIGIAELTDPLGGPAEPLLKMKQLPDAARLSTRAENGDELTDVLAGVAGQLASIHELSPRGRHIDREGGRDALTRRWQANLSEIRALSTHFVDDDTVAELDTLASTYLAGRAALFDNRIAHGKILDGHGDLLADDIFCMPDGARILDCLDFDDRLRYVDGIDDAACLAMDLEYHGRTDCARTFLDSYLDASGDAPPRSLIDHYIAYRATMRAKVACIRYLQGEPSAELDARDHARIALEHLITGTVALTLVGGLPGSGKSTLAAALGGRTGAHVLSSDLVRKELAGIDPLTSCPSGFGEGLYTPSATSDVYRELIRRARELLEDGRSVVLDASWSDVGMRALAADVAASTHTRLEQFECRAPAALCLDRLDTRAAGPSDAHGAVYESMASLWQPWAEAVTIDTTARVTGAVDIALAHRHDDRLVS